MSSYETYLEDVLELKEKEIQLYKNFIEKHLRIRIQEEVVSEKKFTKPGEEGFYKVITIPKSEYVIEIH